jgi:ResB-like family
VPNPPPVPSTKGSLGARFVVSSQPITYRPDARNIPAVLVELAAPEGSLGTWLLRSEIPVLRAGPDGTPQLESDVPAPERFDYAGRTWEITLRLVRSYKPFSIQLLKVTHDNYVGTTIPKNFASQIKLTTPDGRDDRDVLIYMNNPLRYGGYTFYQSQMDSAKGLTGLQVVRNPGWLLPYIACLMMFAGLTIQFGLSLVAFIGKRRAKSAAQPAAA